MKGRAASWQLPDSVLELAPEDAAAFEALRAASLELFRRWGYRLVMPPLLERIEALPPGRDLERLCFRLGNGDDNVVLRPDITSQTARIDARGFSDGEPARLCYAGSALHRNLVTRWPCASCIKSAPNFTAATTSKPTLRSFR